MLKMSIKLDKQHNEALFLIFIKFNLQIFSVSFARTFDLQSELQNF